MALAIYSAISLLMGIFFVSSFRPLNKSAVSILTLHYINYFTFVLHSKYYWIRSSGTVLSMGYLPRNVIPELKDTYISDVRRCCQIISRKVVVLHLSTSNVQEPTSAHMPKSNTCSIFHFCRSNGSKMVSQCDCNLHFSTFGTSFHLAIWMCSSFFLEI